MRVPPFVRRAAWRVLIGGVTCAVIVAVAGAVGERLRFGANLADARNRIERDVQQQFSGLATRLEAASDRVRHDSTVVLATQTRDTTAIRTLFDRLADAESRLDLRGAALTVYGPEARPIAWAGGPATLPIVRITGPESLFLAQSEVGLRLTRVVPIFDPLAPKTRVATLVAEAPLPRDGDPGASPEFVLTTSVVPVSLRLGYEGIRENEILVRSTSGEPLGAIAVTPSQIDLARSRWRARVIAIEAGVLCAMLLLLGGPLLDARRLSRSIARHLTLTLVIFGLLVTARFVAWYAVRLAEIDRPQLVAPQLAGPFWFGLASPLDFLFSCLAVGAVVALVAASFEQWRQGRRATVHVIPERGAGDVVSFVVTQVVSGAVVGVMLVAYENFLRTRLVLMPFDVLHFSLHPFDLTRLAVATGLVLLHATLLAFIVLVFRISLSRWVVAGNYRWIRACIPLLWAGPAAAAIFLRTREWEQGPLIPAMLVVVIAIAAAWRLRRYRAALEHASQAARLIAFFVALAAPSVVFYPSMVDAAERARRQVVETRYAPEVINQRRNLQRQLDQALVQVEALPDLADLVQAGEPVTTGPLPTETAFRVWSRTVLADQRLTSSVELHDAAGSIVSRFALKLPQTGGPQIYQEAKCQWELFEEVSPFFAEERRLLHAGRGICVDRGNGKQEVVGSIAIHVILDYSNLSFISAQSPYVALLRAQGQEQTEPSPREAVEFTVYGWSRRPLYMSGRDAWPLTEDVFRRVYASREPFWARLERGGDEYEVHFRNDRSAIYALGFQRIGVSGHLISVAELLVLGAATYLLLLSAGFVYGFIAARTPTSGRELLREVRASFYRKLFIAFVAAAIVPVLALALVTRAYIANLMQADLEMEATRTAASASRVVEDVGLLELTGTSAPEIVDDDLVVWLSRVIAQDVNIFDGAGLLASSERSLFESGLLPKRTRGDVYRAIVLDGRPAYVAREAIGPTEYLVAASPVRVQNRSAILTVPLTLRQQEIEAQIDDLDRRVLLSAVLFIMLGAGIGYSMAERIADPVNRLMKATGRIARGDLDARILPTSSDEFRRLVDAFNRMAADLQRQRAELERSNRLAAWADMARQVAHDIKNPLTPIQLNAEHLRRVHDDRGTPLGKVLDECVNNILTQVKLLRQIASEFSSFASSPTVKPSATSLHDLIQEVVAPYRTGLAGRITIDADVPQSLPVLMVDKAVLARALTNIIENALHAMPGGGSLILVGRPVDTGRVELTLTDTGVGMDRTALDRIFEPYFSTRASGTGLGLTIAKRNVELNGGHIAVDSDRGKGTTVRITLPTVPAAG